MFSKSSCLVSTALIGAYKFNTEPVFPSKSCSAFNLLAEGASAIAKCTAELFRMVKVKKSQNFDFFLKDFDFYIIL